MSKNDGKRRAFEVDLERCISRGRRSTKDMFIRDVRRSGRRFPERGCSLEHQIRSSGLLRRFCVTHATLRMTWHHFFRGRRNTLETWTGKIAKRIGTRSSALHPTLHSLLKDISQNCFVFDVVNLKNEDVSQNSFVFDVVKFKKPGGLAELLRF